VRGQGHRGAVEEHRERPGRVELGTQRPDVGPDGRGGAGQQGRPRPGSRW
jgi:hypothetical protein